MQNWKRVGIFDSGIGGLTVLSECARRVRNVQYYYLGDNGNAPYGMKPAEEILSRVFGALREFERIGVDAAVLACNTATAVCAEALRPKFPFPIVGMEPALKPAAKLCRRALVLCTPQTAKSERLQKLAEQNLGCEFSIFPLRDLAGEIENSLSKGETPRYIKCLPELSTSDPQFDGIVLGCTHYVFLRREISSYYRLPVFDGNVGTANQLKRTLFQPGQTEFFGINDHAIPPVFLGNWREINERIYCGYLSNDFIKNE